MSKTIKYKFPFYTSRTMLLRQFIQDEENQQQIIATNKLPTSFFENIISINRAMRIKMH